MELVVDDLFESKLQPQSYDLVHARYVIAPLGRGPEQVASYRRLVRPGGSLVLEEWDLGSWHFNPPAPASERLIRLLSEIFATLGGEAGRGLPDLLREIGIEEPEIDAHVIALKPGHPYLRLPLQFSVALESRLLETLSEDELASLRREAESELAEPRRWGTTFTLIQSWGRLEGRAPRNLARRDMNARPELGTRRRPDPRWMPMRWRQSSALSTLACHEHSACRPAECRLREKQPRTLLARPAIMTPGGR